MNILDQFYILFTTDADKASKDIDKLSGNIEKLKEKGTKRTTDENKALIEQQKQLKELTRVLNESQRAGQEFTRIIEGIATTVASGLIGGNIIGGVHKTIGKNSDLAIQAHQLNQNVTDLQAYAAAAEAAGGSQDEFIAGVAEMTNTLRAQNSQLGPIDEFFTKIREKLKSYSTLEDKQRELTRMGIPNNASFREPLLQSEADFQAGKFKGYENAQLSTAQAAAARKIDSSTSSALQAITSIYTKIIEDIQKPYEKILEYIQKASHAIVGTPGAPEGAAIGAIGGGGFLTYFLGKKTLQLVRGIGRGIRSLSRGSSSVIPETAGAPVVEAAGAGIGGGLLTAGGVITGAASIVGIINALKTIPSIYGILTTDPKKRKYISTSKNSGEKFTEIPHSSILPFEADNDFAGFYAYAGIHAMKSEKHFLIHIDKIDVNTQAVDAKGIAGDIGSALRSQFEFAFAQLDSSGY